MSFKNNLYNLRKREGLTQQELADKLYLRQSTISQYERGVAEPETMRLKQIADFFRVTPAELTGETRWTECRESMQHNPNC